MTVMSRIPQGTSEIDAALAEFFAACRPRVLESFRLAELHGAKLADYCGVHEYWVNYNIVATKLINTSLALADRLQGRGRETTHRMVVERVTASTPSLSEPDGSRAQGVPQAGGENS